MIPTQLFVTQHEIDTGNPERLLRMYSRMDIRLARLIEDSISIRLPDGNKFREIRSRFLFSTILSDWNLLPWVAHLGDFHYLRLLRHAVEDFRLVRSAGGQRHAPNKEGWKIVVTDQLENLDDLATKARIPKRRWKVRRDRLQNYLSADYP